MGLFGGGYDKVGKGVDKNEPKKKGFFLFFDIIIHKFTKFLGLNCLYTLASIIWIILLFFFGGLIINSTSIVPTISNSIMSLTPDVDAATVQGSILITLQLAFTMGVFTLWGSGPASAAYSYITRCYTKGEHAWIISDGIDKIKENFKQGMAVILIDAILLVFGLNAIYFYHTLYIETGSMLWLTLSYLAVLVLIIYTMMHPYIYQIMVTFESKIGAIYKNALLITLAKLPGNFFTTLISFCVIFLLFSLISPLVATLVLAIFGLCISRYTTEFYAARVIERTILKDLKEKQPKIEYVEDEE